MRFFVGFVVASVLSGCGKGEFKPLVVTRPDGASASTIEQAHRACVAVGAPRIFGATGVCPPEWFRIDGGQYARFKQSVDWRGSGSAVRVSRDQKLVVKTLEVSAINRARSEGIHDGMCMEKAVHATIGNLDGSTVAVHPIDAGQLTPACEALSMVSDYAGGSSLMSLIQRRPFGDSAVARVGAAAIRILAAVHAKGVIHGDVHVGNWVTGDASDPARSLKIIDFGRAKPFVGANGLHVAQGASDVSNLNPALLSPWELEGISQSRRDDMYRLSEMLMLMKHKGPLVRQGLGGNVAQWLQAKRGRQYGVPRLLADFHEAMLQLSFAEAPDYNRWLQRFENAA